jgi:hypothetical protein
MKGVLLSVKRYGTHGILWEGNNRRFDLIFQSTDRCHRVSMTVLVQKSDEFMTVGW